MDDVLFFFFHHDCIGAGCRQANLLAFNAGDQADIDVVMMTLVRALAAVLFGQLDAAAFDLVDSSDMGTVGPDHFHMFFDIRHDRYSMNF
jgi:hypothetical protein